MREISGETTMFSLMRRKQSKATQGNPQVRLSKKQKQNLIQKRQQLLSDIDSLGYKLECAREKEEFLTEVFARAQEDLQKIAYAIDKEWYETCSQICSNNNWKRAQHQFDDTFRNRNRFHADDLAAKGIVLVEAQLRTDLKEQKKLRTSINKLQTELNKKLAEVNSLPAL